MNKSWVIKYNFKELNEIEKDLCPLIKLELSYISKEGNLWKILTYLEIKQQGFQLPMVKEQSQRKLENIFN